MQSSHLKKIDRTDRNKEEHGGLLVVFNTNFVGKITNYSI